VSAGHDIRWRARELYDASLRHERQLWIQRINAASRANGLTYNRFIQGLKAAGVEVDRRVLSELATNEPETFKTLVEVARKSLV